MSTDLIFFSMPEFGYFIIPKGFSTSSSMMPHKANPDVIELVGAKYHVVSAYEYMISSIPNSTPTGYTTVTSSLQKSQQ